MFGYVVPDKPNILIKDYQTYRAYYCGLCKAIGRRSGQLMRLTLNYDIVFLALLAYNFADLDPTFLTARCPTHAARKVEYVGYTDVLGRIADINAILGYFKILDDALDSRKHRAALRLVRPYFKKASKRLPEFSERIRLGYDELRKKESDRRPIEALCDAFGRMLMSAADASTERADASFREILYHTGRWIYAIDAFDDLEKDCASKEFNPFAQGVSDRSALDLGAVSLKAREMLYDSVDRIVSCYEKMSITISEGPLSNIVYRGFKARTEAVLSGAHRATGRCGFRQKGD